MKSLSISKKFIFLIVLALVFLISAGLYFSSSSFRNLASFSNDEIEYAEDFLFEEESPDYSDINVQPHWKDDLERERRMPNTIQQKLEKELQSDHAKQVLKAIKERTGKELTKTNLENHLESIERQFFKAAKKEARKELVKDMVRNAREDGYEITLDENYQILSSKKIHQNKK